MWFNTPEQHYGFINGVFFFIFSLSSFDLCRERTRTQCRTWDSSLWLMSTSSASNSPMWSFNLGLEILLFDSTTLLKTCFACTRFQSRTRDSSLWWEVPIMHTHSQNEGFNLVLEILLFDGLNDQWFMLYPTPFQSRTRDSSLWWTALTLIPCIRVKFQSRTRDSSLWWCMSHGDTATTASFVSISYSRFFSLMGQGVTPAYGWLW